MMVIELINILGHNTCENNLIIRIKNHQPQKDENGHWKGEKGRQG